MFLNFNKSGSEDVVRYKMYAQKVPDEVNMQSKAFDLGMPEFDQNGAAKIDMNTINGIFALDGDYNLGITSVDDFGNESTMLKEGLTNITLDFVKPDPPTNASVSAD